MFDSHVKVLFSSQLQPSTCRPVPQPLRAGRSIPSPKMKLLAMLSSFPEGAKNELDLRISRAFSRGSRHQPLTRSTRKRLTPPFHAPGMSQTAGSGSMNELMRPVTRLWNWVEHVGGYPGQMLFICVIVMAVVGGLTWYSNKR
jgi:hypothetical protein